MRDNWDDLRFVLAVAETGSVSAAARRLGVNHATVLRRIAAYEDAAGVSIFDRRARGYAVPGLMTPMIEAAREVDRAVQAVGRILRGTAAPLAGEVRVTSTDCLCQSVLAPILAQLRRTSPDLKVELICSNTLLDLGRTQADITVRPALALPEDLVGEVAATLGFGLFRRQGTETSDWLGLSGPTGRSRPGQWVEETVDPARIVARTDSFLVLRELAAEGLGLAVMPDYLGAEHPLLERVDGVLPDLGLGLWVASHADLADVPRIAAARGELVRALAAQAMRLRGGLRLGASRAVFEPEPVGQEAGPFEPREAEADREDGEPEDHASRGRRAAHPLRRAQE